MERTLVSRRLSRSLIALASMAIATGCNDASVTDPVVTAKSFSLALSSSRLTISAGASNSTTISLVPANGAGSVVLTVEGAPTGLTTAFDPSPATTTSVLHVTTVAALAPGSYTLTVRGASTGATDQTAVLEVDIVSAAPSNITVNFSSCPIAERPVWLAFQSGAGAWTRVLGVGDNYTFPFFGLTGGLAFATSADSTIVTVEYFANTDLPASNLDYVYRLDRCPTLSGESLNVNMQGVLAGETGYASFGSAQAEATIDGTYPLVDAADGNQALVGFKSLTHNPGTVGASMYLQRGMNPAGGALLGLDFNNPNFSFPAVSATMVINNLLLGETYMHSMFLYTTGGVALCEVAKLYDEVPGSTGSFTGYGLPGIFQNPGDWHAVGVFTTVSPNSFRTLLQFFDFMGPQTLSLGSELPAPSISLQSGTYKRLQADVTMPAEYQSRATLRYQDVAAKGNMAIVSATIAYLGGSVVSLSLPDFTGVAGWSDTFAPSSGASVFWSMIAENATNPPHCATGAKYISAIRSGTN